MHLARPRGCAPPLLRPHETELHETETTRDRKEEAHLAHSQWSRGPSFSGRTKRARQPSRLAPPPAAAAAARLTAPPPPPATAAAAAGLETAAAPLLPLPPAAVLALAPPLAALVPVVPSSTPPLSVVADTCK